MVSLFLTGRRYSSNGNGWQDDEVNDIGIEGGLIGNPDNNNPPNLAEDGLRGLYYVNDPSNQSSNNFPGQGGNFPQLHNKRWGQNDLQRRQDDLCFFIQSPQSLPPRGL